MICPSCKLGANVSVLETRHSPAGIRRRRKCSCGRKFTTIEMIVPDYFSTTGELRLIPVSELAAIRERIDHLTLADAPGIVQDDLKGRSTES